MTNGQRVKLWDAINRYAPACGGDPSKHVYGNTTRQKAVAEVESIVREVEAPAGCERCEASADAADAEADFRAFLDR